MTTFDVARAADMLDPIRFVRTEDPAVVASDTALMANAGGQLAHAMYHAGAQFVLSLPMPVMIAYARACSVYGLGAPHDSDADAAEVTGPGPA